MPTKRTPNVTAENLQEAARLRALWDSRSERLSQRAFGEAHNIGKQAAVGHFLQGRMPISLKAAMGFAAGLHCQIDDFSPRLARYIAEAGAVSGPVGDAPVTWMPPKKQDFHSTNATHHDILAFLESLTSAQHKSDLFAEFMNRAEIRLMVRLLPADGPHDVMLTLLKSAYDNGFDQGANSIALEMLSGAFGKTAAA